jgi:cation/acetate symporter
MRIYTASSLKSARMAMVWFAFILGLVFSATYAMGFVGVFATETQGIVISDADADKLTIILKVLHTRGKNAS